MTAAVVALPVRRGTSNSNARGSSKDRAARKRWVMEAYRANVDVVRIAGYWGSDRLVEAALGAGEPAVRCWRCGTLLTEGAMTIDRIKPGIEGGTYRRGNIRPMCGGGNSSTGGALGARRKAERSVA